MRSTLKLPQASRDTSSGDLAATAPSTGVPTAPAGGTGAATDALRELIAVSLWPMVAAAFRDVEDHVEVRFFQFGDLQVVISRAPVRGPVRGTSFGTDAERRVTLEVWPPAGPRLLEVEWSGRRPYIVHRREGDWLPRLIRASRQFE
jgi:hypothetical protein